MKLLLSLAVVLVSCLALAGAPEKASPIGKKVADFKLRDYRGADRSLEDFAGHKVVVLAFVGTECPLAKLYGPRLAALAREYETTSGCFDRIECTVRRRFPMPLP